MKYSSGVSYERLLWVLYVGLQVWWILDRFFWNVWPRQDFRIGKGSAGTDIGVDGFELMPGPFFVKFYDVVARISGRYSILALNMLFLTQMHPLFYWLQERPTLNRIIDFSRSMAANDRMHRINGWLIMVLILVHVWSILFPCIFHGYTSEVKIGFFEYPLSERAPKGFKDVSAVTQHVMLEVDDVYRVVLMTLLFGLLLPLSVKWMSGAYHIGIVLHGFIAVMFFIDIVRRHTHPHSWILNTPFFVFWVINKIVARHWRRHPLSRINVITISKDYACLYWADDQDLHRQREDRAVAFECFMKVQDSGFLEPAHAFTGFTNRCDVQLPGSSNGSDPNTVTSCFIIRRYHNQRTCPLSKLDRVSQTARLCAVGEDAVDTMHGMTAQPIRRWGPFVSAYSNELSRDLIEGLPGSRALACVCGGSGISIVLDILQLVLFAHPSRKVDDESNTTDIFLFFSTNDNQLHDWVLEYSNNLFKRAHPKNKRRLSLASQGMQLLDIDTQVGMTGYTSETKRAMGAPSSPKCPSKSTPTRTALFNPIFTGKSALKACPKRDEIVPYVGRQSMDRLVPCGSKVYVIGGPGLMEATEQATSRNMCEFVAGPQYV